MKPSRSFLDKLRETWNNRLGTSSAEEEKGTVPHAFHEVAAGNRAIERAERNY
jgi:hypothetical protein